MALQEAPERRNLYRRFMSFGRYDQGWITGPVFGLTVLAPSLAGLAGVIHFSEQAVREILSTGDLPQAGLNTLFVLGSVALMAGAGYLGNQAELGREDTRRAEAQEDRRNKYNLIERSHFDTNSVSFEF